MTEANLSYVFRTFVKNVATDITQVRKDRLPFFREWVRTNYRYVVYRPNLPSVSIYDLAENEQMPTIGINYRYSSIALPQPELYVLSLLCQRYNPKNIFEFGTFEGSTTHHLAIAAPDAQITTLDLDPTDTDDGVIPLNGDDESRIRYVPGQIFQDTPEEERITQVYGNSMTFDYSPYEGQFDMIFVDADHDYEPALSDSLNAFKLLKSKGIIIWDDYTTWPGLKQALEELAVDYPIQHIEGTRLAFLKVGLD